MEKDKQPLVTVAIVTYQSARFVLETLESVKRQTYNNIELIVSDDCSTDGTIELCTIWLAENQNHFSFTRLITTEKNTGVSANCNRVLKVANGEWLKLFAGDDIMHPTAIEEYVKFVSQNKDAKAVVAECAEFAGEFKDNNIDYCKMPLRYVAFGDNVTAEKQFNILKRMFIGTGPSFFAKVETLKEIGGFDERFRLQEDYPLFIKLTKNGHKLYLLKKNLVFHRYNLDSISRKKDNNNVIYSNHRVQCIKEYKYMYMYENLGKTWRLFYKYSMLIDNAIIDLGNNKGSLLCNLLFQIKRFTDPFFWYSRILNYKNMFLSIYNPK